jgi:hypothetical protein
MNKKILVFVAALLAATGCEREVLDKNPLTEITEDLVWQNPDLARLYLNNVYTNLPGGLPNRNLDCATEIGEFGSFGHAPKFFNDASLTPFNSDYSNEWNTLYVQIRNVNTFLQRYTTLVGDETDIDRLKGEALFLRGYMYAELISLFGGVPYLTEPQTLDDDLLVSRTPYEACVSLIVKDLDESAELLPDEWDDSNIGRATRGAALALKARVLLYAASPLHNEGNDLSKWQLAADAAKKVIDEGTYDLFPDYYRLFVEDNNQEVIFDIQYGYPFKNTDIEYTTNPTGYSGPYGTTRPTQDFIDMYEMANGLDISDPASGYDDQDPYKDRDPRFYSSVLYNGAQWRGRAVDTSTEGPDGPLNDPYNTGALNTGYFMKKFLDEKNSIIYTRPNASQNWILMRYAEVLLNYAEAQNEAVGPDASVYAAVNRVRERNADNPQMPPLPAGLSQPEMRERIRHERTIEHAFEELHFFDVRRWMTAPDVLSLAVHRMAITDNGDGTFTYDVEEMEERQWVDALYYLPILQDEIDKNPKLGQSPDY